MKLVRVFPRRNPDLPTDANAKYDVPGLMDSADEVHVSVAFTYDIPTAEKLAKAWEQVTKNVKIGGPAIGTRGEAFVPGVYLRQGITITSRGCPNKCWFCRVWQRDGCDVRTLPIMDGNQIFDDNLLACPEDHVRSVFAMLQRQKERARFRGGLEAKLLKPWHVDLLRATRVEDFFFAYDTEDDYEPLVAAGKLLGPERTFPHYHRARAYCLIGYPKDTFEKATARLLSCMDAGFIPFAMLYKNEKGEEDTRWNDFKKDWVFPAHTVRYWAKARGKAFEPRRVWEMNKGKRHVTPLFNLGENNES